MKIDIDLIIDKIETLLVSPPKDLNIDQLTSWLGGYATCYRSHIELLREMKKEYGNSVS